MLQRASGLEGAEAGWQHCPSAVAKGVWCPPLARVITSVESHRCVVVVVSVAGGSVGVGVIREARSLEAGRKGETLSEGFPQG